MKYKHKRKLTNLVDPRNDNDIVPHGSIEMTLVNPYHERSTKVEKKSIIIYRFHSSSLKKNYIKSEIKLKI